MTQPTSSDRVQEARELLPIEAALFASRIRDGMTVGEMWRCYDDARSIGEGWNIERRLIEQFFREAGAQAERDRVAALVEVLRRYMLLDEVGGRDQLEREFGAPEYAGSSISEEAWLDRVLRAPAAAALREVKP